MAGPRGVVTDILARAGRGSLSGRWPARADGRPNLRGGITLERALPIGTRLWVSGWTKRLAGGIEFLSLSIEIAARGPRPRRRARQFEAEPEGRFRDVAR